MTTDTQGPHDIEAGPVELEFDGIPIPGWHARPEGMPIAGLVMVPDVMGLRPLFEDHAARVASYGVSVFVLDPFVLVPDAERATEIDARMQQVATFDDESVLGAFEVAADYLVINDDVRDVSIIGFCMGGMYALKAASTGRFARAIALYGMTRVPPQWHGVGQVDPVALIEGAANPSPVLAFFGGADAYTPADQIDDLRAALVRVPSSDVIVYPEAEHGFVHDPSRPVHRPDDARAVWRRVFDALGIPAEPRL